MCVHDVIIFIRMTQNSIPNMFTNVTIFCMLCNPLSAGKWRGEHFIIMNQQKVTKPFICHFYRLFIISVFVVCLHQKISTRLSFLEVGFEEDLLRDIDTFYFPE